MNNQKYSLLIFFSPVIICRIMNPKNKKQTRNSGRKPRVMKTQFYTIEFFLSFTRFLLWTLINIPYYFFLSPVIICRIMNANNNKKKTRNSRRKPRAMKTQFYTIELLFFLSLDVSYEHSEVFPTIFFLSLLIPPFFVECFFSLGFYFAWFLFSRVQNASYFRENPIFCSALFFAWFLFSRV